MSFLTLVLGETKAYYSEDESVETLRAETSGPLTSSPVPVIGQVLSQRVRFEDIMADDIIILCVFPKHYRVSALIPTTSALLDQLEQGRAR